MIENLTWKDVLDSDKLYRGPNHRNIQTFFEKVVLVTGYDYFSWNTRIFKVIDTYQYVDTGLTTDNLD